MRPGAYPCNHMNMSLTSCKRRDQALGERFGNGLLKETFKFVDAYFFVSGLCIARFLKKM